MIEISNTACRMIQGEQKLDSGTADTNNNQKNGERRMIKKDLNNEVNLFRSDYILFISDKEREMNLLKAEVKKNIERGLYPLHGKQIWYSYQYDKHSV